MKSPFAHIEQALPDPILGVSEAYRADKNPNKVNLGVGIYQDDSGAVKFMKVVQENMAAVEVIAGYLPIDGLASYDQQTQKLLFGEDSEVIKSNRAATVQTIGGSGGLKVGADFLARFIEKPVVWISDPSWENHTALFEGAGFTLKSYPYYDKKTHGLNFDGMLDTLGGLPAKAVVLLHVCCHNPTGVDLNREQWNEVVQVLKKREVIPFLDFAYQGFGEGVTEDTFIIRAFAETGMPFLISNSFSKNFSLYGERVGAVTIVSADSAENKKILSQLKRVVRRNYSNPPSFGARIVDKVLSNAELRTRWEKELDGMRQRILDMRGLFVETLKKKGVKQDFSYLMKQRGMFSYCDIPKDAIVRLREEFSIYMIETGRVCIAALNPRNVEYVGEAIKKVLS